MRKALWISLIASVVLHGVLFVGFPDVHQEETNEKEPETREQKGPSIRVRRYFGPKHPKVASKPLPIAPPHREMVEEASPVPPADQEELEAMESLVRLKKTPFLSALDSLSMYAVGDSMEMYPVAVDSSEQMRLQMRRNIEQMRKEIAEEIQAWREGQRETPTSNGEEALDGAGEPHIGGGVQMGFPTDWEGMKRAGRRASLAAKGLVSKKGVEAMVELSALELNIMATLWDLGKGTPEDVYWRVVKKHRAGYRDVANAMEELAVRWNLLRELGRGRYAPKIQRKDVVRFLTQEYIRTDAEDSLKTSDLLRRIQKVMEY